MKFLFNPYFIFRIFSYILGAFIGIDLFNEKITFTDTASGGDDENNYNNEEKKLDKGKGISTESESDSETNKDKILETGEDADKNDQKGSVSSWYNQQMLKFYEQMMVHEQGILDLEKEEREKGTKDLAENIRETVSNNREDDTKDIFELSKALNQTTLNDESSSSDVKRSISEEDDLSENKKRKFEDDSDLTKKDRDNGEGSSGTK